MFDPIMIYGFSIVHLVVPTVVLGLVFPSWFNFIIPAEKIARGDKVVAPMVTLDELDTVTRAVSEEDGVLGSQHAHHPDHEVGVKGGNGKAGM